MGNVFVFSFSFSAPSVDGYVIHVDGDISSIDEISEYGVHHSLECGWGVG